MEVSKVSNTDDVKMTYQDAVLIQMLPNAEVNRINTTIQNKVSDPLSLVALKYQALSQNQPEVGKKLNLVKFLGEEFAIFTIYNNKTTLGWTAQALGRSALNTLSYVGLVDYDGTQKGSLVFLNTLAQQANEEMEKWEAKKLDGKGIDPEVKATAVKTLEAFGKIVGDAGQSVDLVSKTYQGKGNDEAWTNAVKQIADLKTRVMVLKANIESSKGVVNDVVHEVKASAKGIGEEVKEVWGKASNLIGSFFKHFN